MANPINKIQDQLYALEKMYIPDAKREMIVLAKVMERRAADAAECARAMNADEPCSMAFVEFMAGDMRNVVDAKANLESLYAKKKMLEALLRD